MKVTSFLSVCTLALANAVAANHGQYEHKSVALTHTVAPAGKLAHHWVSRDVREYEHSAHADEDKKASYHHVAREACRYEYTHEAPAPKPIHHHWEARDDREHKFEAAPHGGMKPAASRHHVCDAAKPTGCPSHSDSMDEKKENSKPTRRRISDIFKPKKPEDSKAEHGHHFARDADRKEEHKHVEEGKILHFARDADHKPAHFEGKPEGHPRHARDAARKEDHDFKHDEEKKTHHARDAAYDHKEAHGEEMKYHYHARSTTHKEDHGFKHPGGKAHHARDRKDSPKKPEPMHTDGAIAGKPGHHFVRSAARPTSRPAFAGKFASNPYMVTRFSTGSAISSVRGILTGAAGIKRTCDRCVAAMQVGQSLARQSSTAEFSTAVVGLCKQVQYKSNDACESAFSVGKLGPYVSTLQGADLARDGKGFCKQYFGTC